MDRAESVVKRILAVTKASRHPIAVFKHPEEKRFGVKFLQVKGSRASNHIDDFPMDFLGVYNSRISEKDIIADVEFLIRKGDIT